MCAAPEAAAEPRHDATAAARKVAASAKARPSPAQAGDEGGDEGEEGELDEAADRLCVLNELAMGVAPVLCLSLIHI